MPRILVVNDDGIGSEGIGVLARALQALGEVTVVAPDGDRSGTSHSISAHQAVRSQAMLDGDLRRFACSGTPADCVLLGVNGSLEASGYEFEDRFDLFPGHVELFDHFVDAEVFEVLEDGGDGHAGAAEDPCAAAPVGHAFDGGALGPIEG